MNRSLSVQTIRYVIVGAMVYGVDFGTFVAIVTIAGDATYVVANIAAKVTSASVGFLLHKYYTFGGRHQDGWLRQISLYALLLGFNSGASTLLVYICADVLSLPLILSKICSDVVVIVTAFLVSRGIVFRASAQSAQQG